MIWQVLLTPSLPSLAGGGTLKLYSYDASIDIASGDVKTWNYGEPFILSIGINALNTQNHAIIVLDGITIYPYGIFYNGNANTIRMLYDFLCTHNGTVYGLSFPVYDSIQISNLGASTSTITLQYVRVYKYVTN